MKEKLSVKKGDYGYIASYKLKKLLLTLVFAIMLFSVVIGTIVMYGDTKHIVIIFAILLSLPFAKCLLAYLVCARFFPLKKDVYDSLEALQIPGLLIYDLVISQYEGMVFFPSVYVLNGKIYALLSVSDNKKAKEFLTKIGYENTELFSEAQDFIKAVSKTKQTQCENAENDRSLVLKLFDYCV